jgi:steroid delta-isomerase-like uncharacterized protein
MSDAQRDTNKRTIRRLYEDAINRGQLQLIDELVASDFVGVHGETGPAGFRTTLTGLRAGFPDIHFFIDDVIGDGDRVAVRWHWTGTQRGPFQGHPPTDKPVSNTGIAIYQLHDGKVAHTWLESDRLGALQQLGIVPPDAMLRATAKP